MNCCVNSWSCRVTTKLNGLTVPVPFEDGSTSVFSFLLLVSSKHLISSRTIPSLPVEKNDSLVEKGARETLRLLISGANATTSARLIHHGSRGLYSGTREMSGVSLFAPIGLQQPSAGC
ncbi:hypothetical protein Bca52824_003581 [Brassica carinata]|uniref:Uncharacterized protein n=1 Tax=Brassica carinata TaxID=52824 RepID=A0A8X7WLE7_BRACI|nr:hypothetical protein Bca52824_003581 [Brassica carinata]